MNDRKARKSVKILGIRTDSTSKKRVLRFVQSSLKNKNKFLITTPNPEIVLKAQNDDILKETINDSDINLPDGIGLVMAAKYLSLDAPNNFLFRSFVCTIQGIGVGLALFFDDQWLKEELEFVKGREMFVDLVSLANKKQLKIFLLGGEGQVSRSATEELKRRYKRVQINHSPGPMLNDLGLTIGPEQEKIEKEVIKEINEFEPHLLFVAFGAPKQERWLNKWLPELKIGGAMVVGGTFDYISGKESLPPKFVGEIGLEWFWRLFTQPRRFKRIFNAVVVFPWKLFLYKLQNKSV